MDPTAFKARLHRGKPVFGTWSHIPSSLVVEIIGACGLDFIVFDMEHGPHAFSDLPALYCAAENSGLALITRVPGPDNSNVLRCLDCGATGIMIPHIDSLAKAASSLESIYYGTSPHSRGVATLTRASMFDGRDESGYLKSQNEKIVSVLMVEDQGGLDHLDEICKLPNLDVVFVGIYDLAQSLGFEGGVDDRRLGRIFEDTVKRIRSAGVSVGCYAPSAKEAKRLVEMGVSLITIGVDGAMLRRSYEAVVAELAGAR